ncbi:Uncharacterised protein [Pseudomonas putida]|jgi:hypothetical protein|uniref:DUF5629 domain-containing protein n=2 Tax=Pseudomonas TaxID=286 RepID=A0A6S5D5P1_PSEPU|nr:Uncharacterised protein [Pseudomonas putida]SDC59538.1 hypothetical protein SAMN05216185_103335 [Pseudomonas guariconensis]CAB5522690.1 Uncharacterised protein [Pseudomonas putida]CAB5555888.1 Uncharacterised protein [Pseudomonas putida]CAB5566988.1 Uncharacterised protein [Pseudomonas putida]
MPVHFSADLSMTTLATALESCDMLLIDGLHAFDFTFDADGLSVECMDGRQLRRWRFTPEQVAAAVAEGDQWLLDDADGEHRLVCMDALRASEDDDDEDLEEPADR